MSIAAITAEPLQIVGVRICIVAAGIGLGVRNFASAASLIGVITRRDYAPRLTHITL